MTTLVTDSLPMSICFSVSQCSARMLFPLD
uniref:Uncharacterized protein n=1 Tax=Anguilla anguilla TaxID=7936 RepID=A0A0E9SPC9_ANGAN